MKKKKAQKYVEEPFPLWNKLITTCGNKLSNKQPLRKSTGTERSLKLVHSITRSFNWRIGAQLPAET